MSFDVLMNVLMQKPVQSCSKWLQLHRVQHKHHCWRCSLFDDIKSKISYIFILDRHHHQNDGQMSLSFSSSGHISQLELMKVFRWFGNTSASSHLHLNDWWHSFLLFSIARQFKCQYLNFIAMIFIWLYPFYYQNSSFIFIVYYFYIHISRS